MSDPERKHAHMSANSLRHAALSRSGAGWVLVSVAGTKEGGGRVLAECACVCAIRVCISHPGVPGPRPPARSRQSAFASSRHCSSGSSLDGWLMLTVS